MREFHCDECMENRLLRGLTAHSMMLERLREEHPGWDWRENVHYEHTKGPDLGRISYIGEKPDQSERVEVFVVMQGDYVRTWFVNTDGGKTTASLGDTLFSRPVLTGIHYTEWD